jgi:4-oxalocrotonate tautomerase
MPVVTIQMWEGRSVEQKRDLVKAVTKAVVDIVGATPENTTVIIHDIPKANWGMKGALASDLPPKH